MERVLKELEIVRKDPAPDPVHDLRVAIRRCRSVGAVFQEIDPDPAWPEMRRVPRKLFRRLGALRDAQVMDDWVKQLALDGDPLRPKLHRNFAQNEPELRDYALRAVEKFDIKAWSRLEQKLRRRTRLVPQSSLTAQCLAVERIDEARELHARAQRTDNPTTWHELRIGIKRFRYSVENFLPAEHKSWSDELKQMQDLLGEVHDLDVLWATAVSCRIFPDERSRQLWRQRIVSQRSKRIDRYRAKMVGEDSLWQVWRVALPEGKQIQQLATRRMKLWANNLDPDFAHSERVATLALQLYQGLLTWGWEPAVDAVAGRFSLFAASILHDVGKFKGGKNHHKTSFNLIQSHGNPLGWKPADFRRAAIIARFHRGALPTRRHRLLRDLFPDEQKATIQLAAILRLANALDAAHNGHIRRIQIENVRVNAERNREKRTPGFLHKRSFLDRDQPLIIVAEGYTALGPAARTIAAERHLLETVLRRPVVVRPMTQQAISVSRQIR